MAATGAAADTANTDRTATTWECVNLFRTAAGAAPLQALDPWTTREIFDGERH
jgi:hypothetical protein